MTWRKIETAPKDGTIILAWRVKSPDAPWVDAESAVFALIYWSDKRDDWVDYWDGDPARFYPPSHWQPLPKPPK